MEAKINARELRLGNWASINGTISTINMISYGLVFLTGNAVPTEIEKLEPVPLTEEILLKAGFEKEAIGKSWYKLQINEWTFICVDPIHKIIELSINKHGYIVKGDCCLHIIQNLCFYLTTKELTINI